MGFYQPTTPVEKLYSLLFEADNLQQGLADALDFILQTTRRPFGFISFSPDLPLLSAVRIDKNLPAAWTAQLQDPHSLLQTRLQTAQANGQPSPGNAQIQLSAVLPFVQSLGEGDHCLGVLVLGGRPASQSEILTWIKLVHPLVTFLAFTGQHVQPEQAALALFTAAQDPYLPADRIQYNLALGLRQLYQAAAVAFYLLDDDHPGLAVKRTLAPGADWADPQSLPLTAGLVLHTIQDGQAQEVTDLAAQADLAPIVAHLPGPRPRSLICAPLKANGQILGVVLFTNAGALLSPQRMELLRSLASAHANALLYRRLFHRSRGTTGNLEASRWELLNSRNTLRALFDNIPASIYIVDHRYNLVAINLSRSVRAENRPHQIVGKKCFETLYQRSYPCPDCLVQETFNQGKRTERIARDELSLDWEISTFPICAENSDRIVWVIVFEEDVTDKQRMKANLIQSEKLAAIGQLTAGFAHEINNPLTAIVANAQLIQRSITPEQDPDLKESVELILMAGSRASQVVRGLLDFAGTNRSELGSIDLNENIMKAVALIQHEINNRTISLELDLAGDLPPLTGNQDNLQGVWINLIMNAIEAARGSQNLIRLSTRCENGQFRVTVADNGCGISAEHLPHIFEPFYTTKAPGVGTGLGLSVVYRTIQEHGGSIDIDSQVGQGTRFTISLPTAAS